VCNPRNYGAYRIAPLPAPAVSQAPSQPVSVTAIAVTR
jgi:hypothetical protein